MINAPRPVEDSKARPALLLTILSVAAFAIWAAGGWLAYQWGKPSHGGEFGDMFGAVTALFTGLAFAALIVTINFQSRELELQRLELKATRQELSGQRAHMESQATTMKAQAADANFFRLLDMFRSMARDVQHPGQPERGVEYWRRLVKECRKDLHLQAAREDLKKLPKAWDEYFRRWEPTLGPYFATFAELADLIAGADSETQVRWSRVLRSQVTPHEMIILFYHAASPRGLDGLKERIEAFKLFRYFPEGPDYLENKCRDWYAPSAF